MNGKRSSRKRKNLDMESQVTSALKCAIGYVYLAADEDGNGYLFVVTGEMKGRAPGRKDRVHIMYITGPAIGERQSITVEDWNDAINKGFIVGPIKLPDIWTWSDEKKEKEEKKNGKKEK